jgi:DNA-binding MarR family transcriptional regulator
LRNANSVKGKDQQDATASVSALSADAYAVSEALIRIVLAEQALGGGPAADMAPHEIRLAVHLLRLDSATVGELAAAVGISLGWASRIVDRMDAAGHVVRSRDTADRRLVHVRLSDRGRQEIAEAYDWRGQVVERALRGLTAEQREATIQFLQQLAAGLEGGPPSGS